MFTAALATTRPSARRNALSWLCWACVLLSGATGCRTARDNQVDILERELRTQEDYIYELEDYVVQYSEKLRECRCSQPMTVLSSSSEPKSVLKKPKPPKTAPPRSEPLPFDDELLEPGDDLPEERPRSRRTSPRDAQPSEPPIEEMSPEDIQVPELDIGEPVGQVENDSRVQRAAYTEGEQLISTGQEPLPLPGIDDGALLPTLHGDVPPFEDEMFEVAGYQEAAPRTPEQLVVTHLFHNEPAADSTGSLLAVVEALDTRDEPVEVDGEVSLMVMTADAEKPLRLKRWDFTAEDAASAWQSSHLGDGLHLELPLEETELPNAPLELWVRVVNADGSKLLTQLPFERESLAALEPDTGVRELAQAGGNRLVQQEADPSKQEAEGRLLSAEEPVADDDDPQAGWKPSFARSEMATSGASAKSGGWTAQPPGGRFPALHSAESQSAGNREPVWTAGRVDTKPLGTARRGSQPGWSPFR